MISSGNIRPDNLRKGTPERHLAVLGRELVSLADDYGAGIGGPDKTLLSRTIVHLRDVADEIASIDERLNAVKAKYKLAQSV